MGGASRMGLSSPTSGANSPVNFESMPVFQVNSTMKIPDKSDYRTEVKPRRMASLLSRPLHKSGTTKFDVTTDVRSIAPLTSEDIGQFNNLGLMSILRERKPSVTKERTQSVTIDNPPSFYDDDIRKKEEKYKNSI